MKFEVYEDKSGEYRWRLKAANGQIIANKSGCEAGIELVKGASDAPVVFV